MRIIPGTQADGGMELANQQKGFQLVNPTEQWFPGKHFCAGQLNRFLTFSCYRYNRNPRHLFQLGLVLWKDPQVYRHKVVPYSFTVC